jgi:ABC-type phosphate transport system substrate-binding protein
VRHIHTKLAVSALALIAGMTAVDGSAKAATAAIYSGGGTLASKVYRQIFNCYAVPLFGSTNANTVEGATTPFPSALPVACTTGGTYTAPFNATSAGVEFLYSAVGSGAGLTAYTTELASGLGIPATSNSVAFTTTAFSAYPYPVLDFAGSDAALTTTQVQAIPASGKGLSAIQLPAFAVPIALPFNQSTGFTYPTNLSAPPGASSRLRLSPTSICGIFTGKITNWNSSYLTKDNLGTPLVSTSTPITVYVRSDGSGTSQIFSNYLVFECAHTVFPVANGFVASTKPAWPAAFQTASGSGGIATAVDNTIYSISYVSPDFTQPVVPTGPQAANVVDPLNETVAPYYVSALNATSKVTPPANNSNPYLWGQPINDFLAQQATSATNYPSKGYPITGFTFLDFYQCYNGTAAHNIYAANQLRYFLSNFYLSGANPARAEVNLLLNQNNFAEPSSAILVAERTLVSAISYTGTIKGVPGSAACNAQGVVGVNG